MTRIAIKAVPGASGDDIAGWLGDRLKVRISAAPEGGKANKAICALLAEALGVRPADIQIIRGSSSPEKTVEVTGLTAEEIAAKLGRPQS